ncbi:hypothetical protein [Paenarthrobacter sp. NPDC018779]|uniref:hypothetical protein n=1 Tax=Paenarthrobacter sp. NPDC018779 TaxID=3364375 RepID=UPI0037CB919E
MSNRIDAAAKALHAKNHHLSSWDTSKLQDYWRGESQVALAASDSVMFSDEAVERAENAVYSLAAINAPEIVLAVIAALKGDA